MFQISAGIGVNLFVDLLVQIFCSFFVYTKPGEHKVLDLRNPDLLISICIRQHVSPGRGTVGNSPGRKLAENLLYNITPAEALLGIFQGESLQRRNVILN